MNDIRINKFIAENSDYSRREADLKIKEGKVRVDGKIAKLGQKVSKHEKIDVDGIRIKLNKERSIIAYNKPVGVICTTDSKCKDNIIEKVNYKEKVYPVGRLDVNTSGLILLTNDSIIKRFFEDPRYKKEKEYVVNVNKSIKNSDLDKLESGINIGGYTTKKAKALKISDKTVRLVITEGKNRQVRKMFDRLGYSVINLKRTRVGDIKLENLKPGQWREVGMSEITLDIEAD